MAPQAIKKVRVFELAKTLGMDNKAVLDFCRDLGYDVKNQLSSLEPDQVDALKQRIAKGGRPSAAAPAPARPAALPNVEKKITTLPPARKVEAPLPPEEPAPVAEVPVEAAPVAEEPAPAPEPVAPPRPAVDLPARVPVLQPSRPAPVAEEPADERLVDLLRPHGRKDGPALLGADGEAIEEAEEQPGEPRRLRKSSRVEDGDTGLEEAHEEPLRVDA